MPYRILVVDSHALNRLVVAEQLATLGYSTLDADDGHEALALLEVGHFDLVVVECRMPGMDGFALAARIRDLAAARGIEACPVIGYAEDPVLDASLAAQCGMRACLPMPMPLVALEAAVHAVLPQERSHAARRRDVAQWDLFVATSREDVRQARASLGNGQLVQLRDILHRIKGAALMIGENDIAAACARAESGCEEWGDAALAAAIDLVQAHLDAANARAAARLQWEPSR